VHLN